MLISKIEMKKANIILDFPNDSAEMFGRKQKLYCTDSGHYYVPLTKTLPESEKDVNKTEEKKIRVAEKSHQQFSQSSKEKKLSLIN